MKYLLLLLLLLLVLGLWRHRPRQGDPAARGAPPHTAAQTAAHTAAPQQTMLPCALCQLHVPQAQAWPGRQGHYCSAEHRQAREG